MAASRIGEGEFKDGWPRELLPEHDDSVGFVRGTKICRLGLGACDNEGLPLLRTKFFHGASVQLRAPQGEKRYGCIRGGKLPHGWLGNTIRTVGQVSDRVADVQAVARLKYVLNPHNDT